METITDYNQLTLQELIKLANIRKCIIKGHNIKANYVNELIKLDEQTQNLMVCGLCKSECYRINEPCGHILHIKCCIQNEEGFYNCSICLKDVKVSKDDMELLYAEQESKHY